MKTSLLLIFTFYFFNVLAYPPELTNKVKKEIVKHLDDENIEFQEIKELSNDDDLFLKIRTQEDLVGIVVLSSAKGRFEKFDYMIVYNKELQIELIKILVYRSQYGSEITGKRWLSQFYGEKKDSLKYGADIQAISGATFSAMSITKGVNRINGILKEYKLD